jgi:hypothetical protein
VDLKDIGKTSYNEVVVWGLEKIKFEYVDNSKSSLTFEELDKQLKEELIEGTKVNDEEYEKAEMEV